MCYIDKCCASACVLSLSLSFSFVLPLGLWLQSGAGYFGGGLDWAAPPIAYSPNPVECRWVVGLAQFATLDVIPCATIRPPKSMWRNQACVSI